MKIDIVIPIYNAYDFTTQCIESILKYTVGDYNLILINDCSPDNRIKEYLDKLQSKKIDNIYIMHNDVNLGFVGTVNKGMNFSNNDVILLNSDTEVTPKWLEKLIKCAYSNERIATVTPLTNNGTICSVPNFCEDNDIPTNISLNEYAEIVEQVSFKLYPDLPTAVGFCMYIKRKVLDEIGLFDQETFGKGYGEENDFCCRALEAGYTHVLCDDTFIYHKGSTSFLGDKEKYINKNLRILNHRYSYYDSMIQKFIIANPLKKIQDNIKLQLRIRNSKKNILFVLHNDFLVGSNHPIGGTEFHVKDIIEHTDEINPMVMFVKNQEIVFQVFLDKEIITLNFAMESMIYDFTQSSYSYNRIVEQLIDYFRVEGIHIHHLKTHTLDLLEIAEKREIPVFITLHDFYCICPKIKLLNQDNIYCKDIRNQDMCRECLKKAFGYNKTNLTQWNKKMYAVLTKAEKVYVPSNSAKEIFKDYYEKALGEFNIDITVVEHGVEVKRIEKSCSQNSKFRVAFIGGICPEKGSKLINEVICKYTGEDIEWHVFGNIGDQTLNLLEKENLIKHGRYERTEIEAKLNEYNIDLVCVLSIWPETYSYTISESVIAQIPILTMDIGALGERIRNYDCGWLLPYNATGNEILEAIKAIQKNPEDYRSKEEKLEQVNLPTKLDRGKLYENEYLKVPKRIIKSNSIFAKDILFKYKLFTSTQENAEIDSEVLLALREENKELKTHIQRMEETIGWKLLNYLRSNFPQSKTLGKKIIYICAKRMKSIKR